MRRTLGFSLDSQILLLPPSLHTDESSHYTERLNGTSAGRLAIVIVIARRVCVETLITSSIVPA